MAKKDIIIIKRELSTEEIESIDGGLFKEFGDLNSKINSSPVEDKVSLYNSYIQVILSGEDPKTEIEKEMKALVETKRMGINRILNFINIKFKETSATESAYESILESPCLKDTIKSEIVGKMIAKTPIEGKFRFIALSERGIFKLNTPIIALNIEARLYENPKKLYAYVQEQMAKLKKQNDILERKFNNGIGPDFALTYSEEDISVGRAII